MMEQLEKHGIRMVDFLTIGEEESRYLESYFDREIAPLISLNSSREKAAIPVSQKQGDLCGG